MTGAAITGQVALIEDDHTLVINRGSEAGVRPGMIFVVSSATGPTVTDPETGKELGRLSREKLRVRVFDAQPLFARAHTFAATGDVYGLLGIAFMPPPREDAVTVDVGDTVQLLRESVDGRSERNGTDR